MTYEDVWTCTHTHTHAGSAEQCSGSGVCVWAPALDGWIIMSTGWCGEACHESAVGLRRQLCFIRESLTTKPPVFLQDCRSPPPPLCFPALSPCDPPSAFPSPLHTITFVLPNPLFYQFFAGSLVRFLALTPLGHFHFCLSANCNHKSQSIINRLPSSADLHALSSFCLAHLQLFAPFDLKTPLASQHISFC